MVGIVATAGIQDVITDNPVGNTILWLIDIFAGLGLLLGIGCFIHYYASGKHKVKKGKI